MCGIIGILKNNNDNVNVIDCILNGLTILQNRGYDSCGIGYLKDNNIILNKYASTNISNSLELLKSNLKKNTSNNDIRCGIGHNRWATHGIRNNINAHPHISNDDNFILIHNGIIENYNLIKEKLKKNGYKFYSQTDTEVIVALISTHYNKNKNKNKNKNNSCYESIKYAINQIKGTYGIVVIHRLEPNNIYCVRNGSPILVGIDIDKSFCIITSEQSGFNNLINTFFTLDNKIICNITINSNNKIKTNINSDLITNIKFSNFDNLLTPEPYEHWTLREIHEQPETIINAINNGGRIKNYKEVKLGGMEQHIEIIKDIEHLILLGCGSSYNAALYGSYFFKILSGFITVQVIDGADLTYYDIPKTGKTAFIMITQSGETADLYKCFEIAKKCNIITIGVVNVVDSLIARNVSCGIYCNTGRENAVASTKSFTSQVICLSLIALWFSQIKNINEKIRIDVIKDLQNLSLMYKKTLDLCNLNINEIASQINNYNNLFILGKECDHYIANEGALKIKEISYIHAEGYSSSSLKHGPFALLDKDFFVILLNCNELHNSKIHNTFEEIISRNSPVLLITSSDKYSKNVIKVPKCNYYNELLGLIPLQLISYYISIKREINPDKPKNLAKVVSVE